MLCLNSIKTTLKSRINPIMTIITISKMIKIFPIKSETYETGSMITLNGLMKVHFKLYIHVSLILAYNKKAY